MSVGLRLTPLQLPRGPPGERLDLASPMGRSVCALADARSVCVAERRPADGIRVDGDVFLRLFDEPRAGELFDLVERSGTFAVASMVDATTTSDDVGNCIRRV